MVGEDFVSTVGFDFLLTNIVGDEMVEEGSDSWFFKESKRWSIRF